MSADSFNRFVCYQYNKKPKPTHRKIYQDLKQFVEESNFHNFFYWCKILSNLAFLVQGSSAHRNEMGVGENLQDDKLGFIN